MTKGGRNLLLLGVGSIAIAVITTGISLTLYNTSGDIYLDRSRPGFLPDEKESSEDQQAKDNYKFPDSGNLDKAALTEYLNNIKTETKRLDQVKNPFDTSVLSDEALGITGKEVTPAESNSDNVDTNQDAQHIHD